jgi:hypothetical protein
MLKTNNTWKPGRLNFTDGCMQGIFIKYNIEASLWVCLMSNKIFHPHNAIDNALINLDHWIVVDSFYCMAKRISNGDVENLSMTWAINFPHTFKANPGSIILFPNEKNLLTKKINYPDIKGMKTLDYLTSTVNKLSTVGAHTIRT